MPMNTRKIIIKASTARQSRIWAIEVAMKAGRRGIDAVPPLYQKRCSARGLAGAGPGGLTLNVAGTLLDDAIE